MCNQLDQALQPVLHYKLLQSLNFILAGQRPSLFISVTTRLYLTKYTTTLHCMHVFNTRLQVTKYIALYAQSCYLVVSLCTHIMTQQYMLECQAKPQHYNSLQVMVMDGSFPERAPTDAKNKAPNKVKTKPLQN